MQVTWTASSLDETSRLTAEVEDFDGWPPVAELRVSADIHSVSPDRVAVAAALAFAPWISGTLTLDRPFSALTAQRISEFFDGIWVSARPVRRGALPIPRGDVTVGLSYGHGEMDSSTPRLAVSGPSAMRGHLAVGSTVTVASTAPLLTTEHGGRPPVLSLLAVGVLCSESLGVGTFRLLEEPSEQVTSMASVARLLECVSLGLVQ